MTKKRQVSGKVNMIPTLRKIMRGAVQANFGRASLETLSGRKAVKEITIYLEIESRTMILITGCSIALHATILYCRADPESLQNG